MKHAALECTHCGAPVTYKVPFCPYCRAKLAWDAHLMLQRAAPFAMLDLARDPLPAEEKRWTDPVQRPDGTLLVPDPSKLHRGHFRLQLRNACCVVAGVCLDPHGILGIMARMHKHGRSACGYQLAVYPAFKSFRFRRLLWIDGELQHVITHDWEFAPQIAGVGQSNEVELRAADSLFQILVNGEITASIVDACFGFGQFGWCVASESDVSPAQVLLQRTGIFRVG